MTEDKDRPIPKVGDKWQYGTYETYWVTFIDDSLSFVHITQVESGEEFPTYPLKQMCEPDSEWHRVGRAEEAFCGACEERLKAENDYLCEECRYGIEGENDGTF